MYPRKTNRDAGKHKWQNEVRNAPKKRLLTIADKALWEKTTKGRAGIRWDSIVEKEWKGMLIVGNQEDILSIEAQGGTRQR